MARFQNFRNRAGRYGSAARGYAGRVYGGYRKAFGRVNKRFGSGFMSMGLNLSAPFLLGGLVGLTDHDDKIPAEAKIAVACLPVRGGPVGMLKAAAQGMLIADLAQHMIQKYAPGLLGGATASTSNTPVSSQNTTFGI